LRSAVADGVVGFNSLWKPDRPFPIDMAAFAVHINLILENPFVAFTYNVARGYQVGASFICARSLPN
jgi:galactosylgalactosylxylosylprotein 3-beta-glucuronosyltransferase 3